MINLDDYATNRLTTALSQPVLDARLELNCWLGNQHIGTFTPTAGKITWNDTTRKGLLDIDIHHHQNQFHDHHPASNIGQTYEANWKIQDASITIPCGWWRVTEGQRITDNLWRITADPAGIARLDMYKHWQLEQLNISGALSRQISTLCTVAGVAWTPASDFSDTLTPGDVLAPGDVVLKKLEDLLANVAGWVRPSRWDAGVEVGRDSAGGVPAWTISDDSFGVVEVKGTPTLSTPPNRVSVYYEKEENKIKTIQGWSEAIVYGSRRWGGPYGQIAEVVRLEGEASQADMQRRCREMLYKSTRKAGSVEVSMRADPRIEICDSIRVISLAEDTDASGFVEAVSVDVASGLMKLTIAANSGRIAGVTIQ